MVPHRSGFEASKRLRMRSGISVVINTLNEEKNLPHALGSVASWAEEIIVVDMHSEDRTCEIAREYGARVFLHDRAGYVEPAREFAVGSASAQWVLVLDADEIIPKKLADKLISIVENDAGDAYKLPRLNYFFGAPVMHTGWGPDEDGQLRFFRKGSVIFSKIIHSTPELMKGMKIDVLNYSTSGGIVHFPYVNFSQFVKKMDSYTGVEAVQLKMANISPTYIRVLLTGVKEFIVRFFLQQGFRDGWKGFYLSTMMVFYKILVFAKLKEMVVQEKRDVSNLYEEIAQGYVSQYKE